jgi:hypothetical protein
MQCGRFPPALHRTQCGASVASLGMTLTGLMSPRAAAGGVAVSRGAVAEAVREIPTCTAPYAVRCKCRFARNDINRVYVTASERKRAWRSPGKPLRRRCGRFPPALHRTQCGRFPPALHRTQCGRFPPALHRTQCGASVASLGMTLTQVRCKCRFARNDINRVYVTASRRRRRGGLPQGRRQGWAG